MGKYRTNKCDELDVSDEGKEVVLSGFVRNIRDLGALVFVDLKDHYGTTQLVLKDSNLQEEFRKKVSVESTVKIDGIVIKREEENIYSTKRGSLR